VAGQPGEVPAPEPTEVADDDPIEPDTVYVGDLCVGDCFDMPESAEESGEIDEVRLIPCGDPHDTEVFALVELPTPVGEPYPDEDQLATEGEDLCKASFESYVGVPYVNSSLWMSVIYPGPSEWRKGDRAAACLLLEEDARKMDESVAGRGR
jgi:hypothetical protein